MAKRIFFKLTNGFYFAFLEYCLSFVFWLIFLQLLSSNVIPKQSRSPSLGGRTADREAAGRIRIPHTFVLHSYMRPTVCHFCRKLLKGIIKQGLQCRDCHCNAHKKCVDKIPNDCFGESLFHVLPSFCYVKLFLYWQYVNWYYFYSLLIFRSPHLKN